MSAVIDCSVALNWVMPDEHDPRTDALLERVAIEGGAVPVIFRIEVGNALLMAVRRKRITVEFRNRAFEGIDALALSQDRDGAGRVWTDCVVLAETHGLSLYDATYLELAKRLGLPLATLDGKLAQAARQTGVALPWADA